MSVMTISANTKETGYRINWTESADPPEFRGGNSQNEFFELKDMLYSRYSGSEPLKVFMLNLESLLIKGDQIDGDHIDEAFYLLQSLEDICWALDLEMAMKRQ